MSAVLNPYLHFRGNAREAMTFYQQVFGGTLRLMTFADSGGMGLPEDEQGSIMHGQLDLDDMMTLMGADTPSTMEWNAPTGITVSLSGDDDAVLRHWWGGLSEGATIQEELTVAPWGDAFGMLVDRFGVPWLVNISGGGSES